MFGKRDDGLGTVFLPFDIGALILAALLTARGSARGLACVPVFIGWWVCMFLALLLLYLFIVFLISLTVDMKAPPPEEDHPFFRFLVVRTIGKICRCARVRIHTSGLEKLPEGRFLFVSNHRSGFDPICAVWALRKTPTAFITKPENLRIPLAGGLIYRANYLPIDREDPREAMKTIKAATELLKNDVVSVGVYPEGTRNRETENGLLPFHNGVFKIAQRAGVPLVVAATRGVEDIGKNAPWRHTDVYIDVREVIPAEELTGPTAAVSERARAIIEAALEPELIALT